MSIQHNNVNDTLTASTATGTLSGFTSAPNLVVANVTATAGSGATNYIHFSSAATGTISVNTNTLLTYNYTNNALTSGITGGTF